MKSVVSLKKTVYLKKVSENQTFAVDLSNDEESVYKFSGPSHHFIHLVKEELNSDQIFEKLNEIYGDMNRETFSQDFDDFIKKCKEFHLLNN